MARALTVVTLPLMKHSLAEAEVEEEGSVVVAVKVEAVADMVDGTVVMVEVTVAAVIVDMAVATVDMVAVTADMVVTVVMVAVIRGVVVLPMEAGGIKFD